MSKDTAFNGETTPRHTILCSDSQCLPPGDPKILCAKHEYPITGKSFIIGEVYLISEIIEVEVSVISQPNQRPRLITFTEILIIQDITKTESNNCFIIHCFEENNDKHCRREPNLTLFL